MKMPDPKNRTSSQNSNGFIKPSQSKGALENRLDVETSGDAEVNDIKPKTPKTANNMIENKMKIEPGDSDLEEYMLPSSAKNFGSRPPTIKHSAGAASASSRKNFRETWSSIAPSLKVLSPDEIQDQEMQELEIEDFGSASGSDLTDDSDDDEVDEEEIAEYLNTLQLPVAERQLSHGGSSLFQVVEPGKLDKESTVASSQADWEQESLVNTARQISLLENEPDSELDSEEENLIMREIKDEITKQVKNEMKDELTVMKRHIQDHSGASKPVGDDDLENLEPDLKAAILKVRKLDRILAKKVKREREVKRDRILLQRKLKKELEELKPEGRDEIKEAQVNTSKFLALTLPPRHNAGIRVTEDGEVMEDPSDSPPVTPLFTTQVPEEFESKSKKNRTQSATTDQDEDSRCSSQATHVTDSTSASGHTHASSTNSGKGKKKSKKRKNFIKRNMELAGDAANPIAMTEEEKHRVGDLLADLDEIPESFIEEEPSASGTSQSNPYQITLSTGEGFHPALDERKRMEAIDRRLQGLLPKSDFESIASTPMPRGQSQQSLFTRTRGPTANYDLDQLGERALRETKEERDLYQRLKDIEFELTHITDRYEPEVETPTLSQETLDHLLNDCVRTMSTTDILEPDTPEPGDATSRSGLSVASRASLLSNAPRLEADVLQELLADARRTICGSAASQYLENGHDEGDMRVESAAETPTNGPADLSSRAGSRTPQQGQLPIENQPSHLSSRGDAQSLKKSPRPVADQSLQQVNSQNRPLLADTHSVNNGQGPVLNGGNSRPTTADSASSSRPASSSSIVSERKSFFPEIDPRGRMSTQRQGSSLEMPEMFPKTPTQRPQLAKTVWSSFSEQDTSLGASRDSESRSNNTTPVPHPPSSGRKSKNKKQQRTGSGSPAVK